MKASPGMSTFSCSGEHGALLILDVRIFQVLTSLTPLALSSLYLSARRPISVVHTGCGAQAWARQTIKRLLWCVMLMSCTAPYQAVSRLLNRCG